MLSRKECSRSYHKIMEKSRIALLRHSVPLLLTTYYLLSVNGPRAKAERVQRVFRAALRCFGAPSSKNSWPVPSCAGSRNARPIRVPRDTRSRLMRKPENSFVKGAWAGLGKRLGGLCKVPPPLLAEVAGRPNSHSSRIIHSSSFFLSHCPPISQDHIEIVHSPCISSYRSRSGHFTVYTAADPPRHYRVFTVAALCATKTRPRHPESTFALRASSNHTSLVLTLSLRIQNGRETHTA